MIGQLLAFLCLSAPDAQGYSADVGSRRLQREDRIRPHSDLLAAAAFAHVQVIKPTVEAAVVGCAIDLSAGV